MWIKLLCLVPKAFENLSTVDRSSRPILGMSGITVTLPSSREVHSCVLIWDPVFHEFL